MPQPLKIAASQSPTLSTLSDTLAALKSTAQHAASKDISILLFPEAYLGGYPRTCSFGSAIGSRSDEGREQYLQYYNSAVDLGDTPLGAGPAWLNRTLPVNGETGRRGDGTREFLEDVARETGVFLVTGLIERTGGSLFCTAVFVDPQRGIIGKRRKLMPTGSERLVWSQGTAETLKAVVTTIKGVRLVLGCAICWENLMPLLRYSLYSQGVNLWLAPTADGRDSWGALVRTIAMEGRCFVLSANQCQKKSELPAWIGPGNQQAGGSSRSRTKSVTTAEEHEIALPVDTPTNPQQQQPNGTDPPSTVKTDDDDDVYVSRGGSCVVSPLGTFLHEPLWDNSRDLITAEIDLDDCARAKLDFDVAGHYARSDQFRLSVMGLDLNPPP